MERCLYSLTRRLHTSCIHRHSFITTPIFYVNADPHIGHLYSALLADAAHRWQLVKGVEPAVFSTGTDEHGLKVQKAAAAQGCSPRELCDRISQRFKNMFNAANIGFTDYIRTTEARHVARVEAFWEELYKRGHIYKGSYEGWYSVPDEAFLSSSQVVDGSEPGTKVSLETGHVLEWFSEENYLFRLTDFREKLLHWINTKPYPITPESAHHQVHQYLIDLNSDLSVSRPRSRLQWGVPVPGDHTQTIYVWLDALINYLTVSGHPSPDHTWPATVHIVGKDILRFHAVFWPAFLMAAGLELPRRVVTHSHWTMGKTKMSKSKGNVVDPFQQMERYGVDSMRFFLLREGSLQQDGDYSEDRVVTLLNSDLADTLGNLLQRVTSKRLHPEGKGKGLSLTLLDREPLSGAEDVDLLQSMQQLPDIVDRYYEDFEFNKGIAEVMKCLYQTNQFLERHKPWQLVKDPTQHDHVQTVLGVAIEAVRLCSCLLYPIIPTSATTVLQRIGVTGSTDTMSEHWYPSVSDIDCWLSSQDGVRRLELATQNMTLGGTPLFKKETLNT